MADAPAQKFDHLKPKVALGIAAHPDDLDFAMAGTVATWAAEGCAVYYLILTNGNKGSADLATDPKRLTETRQNEQRAAAQALGVKDVYFYNYDDGLLEVTMALKRDIVRVIRKVKPDVVLTLDPSVLYDAVLGMINHPDHRAAGQATLDAVYPLARDHLSFPELLNEEHLQPHITPTLLLTNFSQSNYTVDISSCIDKKMTAIAAHVSQKFDQQATLDRIRAMAEQTGTTIGVQCAESFMRIDIQA